MLKSNTKMDKLLQYALSYNPDVLCLQEVPTLALEKLRSQETYSIAHTHDFINQREGKNCYISTLSKDGFQKTEEITYFDKSIKSLLNNFFYKKLGKNEEMHKGLLTDFRFNNKEIRLINVRLSCATGPTNRIEQFKNVLKHLDKNKVNMVCGDLNIVDSIPFNVVTGWARGFKKREWLIDERKLFEEKCMEYGLTNIFRGITTVILPFPLLQLDHILVPKGIKVKNKEVSKHTYGSDHRMLMVDLDLS